MEKDKDRRLSSGVLTLIAILLVFVLTLVFIWLWYDIKMAALDKEKSSTHATQ